MNKFAIHIVQLIAFLLFLIGISAGYAQSSMPVIGEPCPDFTIVKVQKYAKTTVTLSDLKGRFVVLDFWHRYCGSCLRSFPKMNDLAKEFQGKVDFFMVGLEDEIGLKDLYDELDKRYDLQLSISRDSALFNRFVPGGAAPHIILIDSTGIVRAIRSSVDRELVQDFLSGKTLESDIVLNNRIPVDSQKIAQTPSSERFDNHFKASIVSNYDETTMSHISKPRSVRDLIVRQSKDHFEAVLTLDNFYRLAYLGSIGSLFHEDDYLVLWYRTLFDDEKTASIFGLRDRFYYYSKFDKNWNEQSVQKTMQQDLQQAFDFRARVEWRDMPCWYMSVDSVTLSTIISKGGNAWWDSQTLDDGQIFTNQRFSVAMSYIFMNCFRDTNPIVIDPAIADVRVDFVLNDKLCIDFDHIRTKLAELGIQLHESTRRMKVLVIE